MNAASRWASRTKFGHAIGGVVLILLGLAAIPLFWDRPHRKFQARNWPTARAVVTGAAAKDAAPGPGALVFGKQVEIRFFYSADGSRFDATQVIGLRDAKALALPVPDDVGMLERQLRPTRVECHYNPAAPSEAVILRELRRGDLAAIIPLVPVAIGIGLIARGRRVARESVGPVGRLKHRNQNEWDVEATEQGIRCVPNNRANKLTLSRIGQLVSGGDPLAALELLSYPLRLDRPTGLRLHRRPGHERRNILIHLEAIEHGRSFVGLRGASRSEQVVVSTGDEGAEHVFEFDVPGDEFVEPSYDLRLRVTTEAGATPRFLWMELDWEGRDTTRTAAAH